MSTETTLPKSFDVDPQVVENSVKRDVIANVGFIEVVVTKAENKAGGGKVWVNGAEVPGLRKVARYQTVLTMCPLKTPGDTKTVQYDLSMPFYLILPDRTEDSVAPNSKEEEDKAQRQTVKSLVRNLRAMFGDEEVPHVPAKQPNGRYLYLGEEIQAEEYDAALKDISAKALALAYKMWTDEERWVSPKRTAYAKIKQEVQNDGSSRARIHFITNPLPHDAVLMPYAEWFKSVASDE